MVEALAVGISCNPIWDEGDASRKILTGVNREASAAAASKHSEGRRKMLKNRLNKVFTTKRIIGRK